MIGYGAEDSSFVCELTYNYEVGKYAMGNDFQVCFVWRKIIDFSLA